MLAVECHERKSYTLQFMCAFWTQTPAVAHAIVPTLRDCGCYTQGLTDDDVCPGVLGRAGCGTAGAGLLQRTARLWLHGKSCASKIRGFYLSS